ncbi:MAG: 50S ribosomal protein L17 [Parcubacteria group bacterium]|nr:50S ribosomal protein L17 [Parcubacteria group bacterium]
MRALAINLLTYGRIKTSLAKAKVIRPFAERLITIAKQKTLASRRLAIARLGNTKEAERAAYALFETYAPLYATRAGGYTLIIKLGARKGDAAQVALIEFLKGEGQKEPQTQDKK